MTPSKPAGPAPGPAETTVHSVVTISDLLHALDRLTPETIPSWGRLSATGMVRHVNQTIDLHLGRIQAPLHLKLLGRMEASTLRAMTHHHLRYHLFQFGVID